jgi:hypothetical protein
MEENGGASREKATKTTLPGKRPAPESGAKRGRADRLLPTIFFIQRVIS